jgi:hypothetical protein
MRNTQTKMSPIQTYSSHDIAVNCSYGVKQQIAQVRVDDGTSLQILVRVDSGTS